MDPEGQKTSERERAVQEQRFFSMESLPWGWRERAHLISADTRSNKLDLRAGIFLDREGSVPELEVIKAAKLRLQHAEPHGYYLPLGHPGFTKEIASLFLGSSFAPRTTALQTVGATHALRMGGECLSRLNLADSVYISSESWGDHRRIFERAGLKVKTYPYLASSGMGIDEPALLEALRHPPPRSVFLLQLCCHNPTGYDLSPSAWGKIFDICEAQGALPFFDISYAGFGTNLEADLLPLQECAARGLDCMAAVSYCKMFSLYEERVGALIAMQSTPELAERFRSQIKVDIQASISSAPHFGAALVATVLGDPALQAGLRRELTAQYQELEFRRASLVDALVAHDAPPQLLAIAQQRGFFAWTGMSKPAVEELAQKSAIYLPSNGRISLAALPLERCNEIAAALINVSR